MIFIEIIYLKLLFNFQEKKDKQINYTIESTCDFRFRGKIA